MKLASALLMSTPPHLPAWWLLGRRPLLRTPERRLSSLAACRGLSSPPQAAPKVSISPSNQQAVLEKMQKIPIMSTPTSEADKARESLQPH